MPLLGATGIAASAVFIWATALGLGATPDSVLYLDAARSLRAREGFLAGGRPLTLVPPLYPMLVAAVTPPGASVLESARWLHAALFAANACLVAIAGWLTAGRSSVAACLAAALFLVSPELLQAHATVWSESAFITCMLAATLLMWRTARGEPGSSHAGAGVAMALGAMVRYAGVFLPVAWSVATLADRGHPPRRRIRDAVLVSLPALLALGAWACRNVLVEGTTTGRTLVTHAIPLGAIKQAAVTTGSLWFPFLCATCASTSRIVAAAGAAIVGVPVMLAARAFVSSSDARTRVHHVVGVMMASYLLVVFASIWLVDASTRADARILSPLFVLTLVWWVGTACARMRDRRLRSGASALLAILVAVTAPVAATRARDLRAYGSGFTSREWTVSPGVALVRATSPGLTIYTNGDDVVRLLTGRRVASLPLKWDPVSRRTNGQYGLEVDAVVQEVARGRALVVYFDRIDWRGYLPSPEELEGKGLAGGRRVRDAVVYGADK